MVTEYQRDVNNKVRFAYDNGLMKGAVMPDSMWENWRRRAKRLERARIRAYQYHDYRRAAAVAKAIYRLHTGRTIF